MSEFTRSLKRIDALIEMSKCQEENWWKDLLALWNPSGSRIPNGEHGLRLAVRKNYLNFYFKGQSIAEIRFTTDGIPYAKTHIKFAFEGDKKRPQEHSLLIGTSFTCSKLSLSGTYLGPSTLLDWIKRADAYYSDNNIKQISEKASVDDAVGANSAVIDLEMALPAWEESKTALRIDMVALEPVDDRIKIVFWEAKSITDSRLVASNGTEPEVVEQFRGYKNYLVVPQHKTSIVVAYQEACRILCTLHAAAKCVNPNIREIDPLISRVCDEPDLLILDEIPRLVIFEENEQRRSGNWDKVHEPKLRNEIAVTILNKRPFVLPRGTGVHP